MLMCVFVICAMASLILPYYLYTEYGVDALENVLGILASIVFVTGIFVGLIIYLKIKGVGRMKKFYEKFEQLSDVERSKINSDLSVKFGHVLWGEERLYIRSTWAIDFVAYKDIAWIYPHNFILSMITPVDYMIVESHQSFLGLQIYDIEGTRYKIHTQNTYEAAEIVKRIKKSRRTLYTGITKNAQSLRKKILKNLCLWEEILNKKKI
jgi:uncharacterized membrane-anchored protein YhcB (DUF1043 family)